MELQYIIPHIFFGLFSSFNPDIIEGYDLYKSSIPVKYGGRISSVMDVTMKEGDMEQWSAKGGISPIASRITVEGPLKKNRTSLIVSGRSTYSDWILGRIENASFRNSKANYYDISSNLKTRFAQNDLLEISSYFSNDNFPIKWRYDL